MFWITDVLEEKRRPNAQGFIDEDFYLGGRVYKDPVWKYPEQFSFSINGVKQKSEKKYIGSLEGEKIKRTLKKMIRVKLCRSERVDKKPRRVTVLYSVIRYWDVIDDEYNEYMHEGSFPFQYLEGVYERMDKAGVGGDVFNGLIEKLKDKLKPIIDEFKADYEKSEEYHWLRIGKEIEKKNLKKDRKAEAAANAKEKKSNDEYQKRSREYSRHRNYSGGCSQPKTSPKSDMEAELIKAGYKALSKKLHPDAGGDHKKFVELGEAKEALLGG